MMVQRYRPDELEMIGMHPESDGDYVDYEDYAALEQRVRELEAERDEMKFTFNLVDKADQRGIKMYQRAHPESGLALPDTGKLICWLIEQLNSGAGSREGK